MITLSPSFLLQHLHHDPFQCGTIHYLLSHCAHWPTTCNAHAPQAVAVPAMTMHIRLPSTFPRAGHQRVPQIQIWRVCGEVNKLRHPSLMHHTHVPRPCLCKQYNLPQGSTPAGPCGIHGER